MWITPQDLLYYQLKLYRLSKKSKLENATEMSIASNLAGKAISISKTTVPHAVSYPFTFLFNISHGHAVSLFFERFFRFNFENIDKANTSFDNK